jgi:uncharacterized iron-regulated membrane protein
MKLFRTIVFWAHLVAGLCAGLIILVMSITGSALAFDPQITTWAEASSRRIEPGWPDEYRLNLDQLLARAKSARPDQEPNAVTFYPEAASAVRVSTGRDGGVFVDPYRGSVRELGGQTWRSFSRFMLRWHRWLGAEGEGRDPGKAIKSLATLALMFMTVSGLYLWWPRRWSRRVWRRSIWFRRGLSSQARDWNWHNTFGFWALPLILVITVSGSVLAYDWARGLLFRAAGEAPPTARAQTPAPSIGARPPGTPRVRLDAVHALLTQQAPSWTSATLRLGNGREEPRAGRSGRGPRALMLMVKQSNAWPRSSHLQIWLDPFSGEVLRREGFADASRGRRAQIWMRYLHTGEALGWPGQLAALVAALACGMLVWTGSALAWRRFFRRRRSVAGDADLSTETAAFGWE